MNKKFSLVAALSVLALVGAGCSTVSDDTMKSTSDDTVVSNGDTMEQTETTSVHENTTGGDNLMQEETKTSAAYNVGDDVMVDLGYGWYEGKVEDFACDAGYYVRYRGLSASCITEDKLVKPVAPSADSLVVGAKVIANIDKGEMFGGKEIFPYYSGEITAVNASTYTVKDNSNKEREITIDKIYLK